MSQEERDQVLHQFNTEDQLPLLLLSLNAGGIGLNLVRYFIFSFLSHLSRASVVFICDPWWNPFVEEQAIDRVHRIGQTRPVSIYKLYMNNTVEVKIEELQKKKVSLVRDILDLDGEQDDNRLTINELCSFFDT